MTDTGSDMPNTQRTEESHGESHTSMSARKSRRKSHVDASAEFPQVRKSRDSEEKVTRPLPRKVTFSALSLRRAERDPRGGRDQQNTPSAEPKPVGPIAEKLLDQLAAQQADPDLAARQRDTLARLRRQTPALRRQETQP